MDDLLLRDLMAVELDTTSGFLAAQLGDAVTGEVTEISAEWFQQPGFMSAPSNPVAGVAAQALCVPGQPDQCIAVRDPRFANAYGPIAPGETCVYAGGPAATGQGRVILKDDGTTSTIALVTSEGNEAGGTTIQISITSAGDISLSNALAAFQIKGDGTISCMNSGKGGFVISPEGRFTIYGTQVDVGGQKVALGLGASPATPALHGASGPTGLASTSVVIAL